MVSWEAISKHVFRDLLWWRHSLLEILPLRGMSWYYDVIIRAEGFCLLRCLASPQKWDSKIRNRNWLTMDCMQIVSCLWYQTHSKKNVAIYIKEKFVAGFILTAVGFSLTTTSVATQRARVGRNRRLGDLNCRRWHLWNLVVDGLPSELTGRLLQIS